MAAKRTKRPSSIKLNLIPPYVAAARKTKAALALTIVVCLLILGGMGIWWRTNAAEIVRLSEELQRKQQEAQKVKDLQSRAEKIKSEVADISNALKVLDDIHKSGEEWAGILEKIAAWIPEEVRLTALNFEGSPTNAQAVVLVGYTTSVNKLRDFYSQLSQSALFTSVSLLTVDKNGRPVPVSGLPPVLPKEKPKGPEVTTELAPPGQQQPSPGPGLGAPVTGAPEAPGPMGATGMGMHGAPMPGSPGMGMHGAPMSGGPGMGMHGPGMTGGPGMGMHGGPGMGGPGAPPPWALGGGPMMGTGQQQQIIRDPTAPRNAVYFLIRATLARQVQVASSLRPLQPLPGAMPSGGMMPMGGMPPGAMPPEEVMGAEALSGAPTGTAPQGAPATHGGAIGGVRQRGVEESMD